MKKTMEEKLAFLRTCETGYITDALNLLGIKNCWAKGVLPLRDKGTVAGPAFTAQLTRIQGHEKTYTMYDVVRDCPKGHVAVFAGVEGLLLVGGNITTLAQKKGIEAVVLDGKCRDVEAISALDMPVFLTGIEVEMTPSDLKITHINAPGHPVRCNGATIYPGDIVVGDADGVVVIPAGRLDDVMYQAEWVASVERESAERLVNETDIDVDDFVKALYRKKQLRG